MAIDANLTPSRRTSAVLIGYARVSTDDQGMRLAGKLENVCLPFTTANHRRSLNRARSRHRYTVTLGPASRSRQGQHSGCRTRAEQPCRARRAEEVGAPRWRSSTPAAVSASPFRPTDARPGARYGLPAPVVQNGGP